MDAFGRAIDYLRISVTHRCNERCLYCRPSVMPNWRPEAEILTNGQILRLVRAACNLGFRKFRLTGGEPLERPDLPQLVAAMKQLPGVCCLGLSTNATQLEKLAQPLQQAGIRSVNISLDALDPARYRQITGGDLQPVLAGISAAIDAGFERLKLNMVAMRGVNEEDIWPLVHFAAERHLPLRFIELMPLTSREVLRDKHFLPVVDIMQRLQQRDRLDPAPDTRIGHGPARYFRLAGTGAIVGFIGALTDEHFCDRCNKMRLTADGKLRPCLGSHGEVDVRPALQTGDDHAVLDVFRQALAQKPWAHDFRGKYQPCRPMTAIGG
jgi:GTP 3',8-cyclase